MTATARAPKAGDLRFHQVDATSTINGYMDELGIPLGSNGFETFGSATGSPLWLANDPAPFQFRPFLLPSGVTGLNTGYIYGPLDSFQTYLSGSSPIASTTGNLSAANAVITSMSLNLSYDVFALSYIQTTQSGGFDLAQHTVAPSDFQAAATQEGAHSRVITAVSYNAGQITYFSYGWQQDISTIYETMVSTATISTASSLAQNLAAQGYIITATGSDRSSEGSHVVLIGTRVQGDTVPRPMMVVPLAQLNTGLPQMFQQGYAIVGVAIQSTSAASAVAVQDWIGER